MLDLSLSNQRGEAYLAQKTMNLIAQVTPKMMGEANFALLAITGAATTGGINRFIDCVDDLRDKN